MAQPLFYGSGYYQCPCSLSAMGDYDINFQGAFFS